MDKNQIIDLVQKAQSGDNSAFEKLYDSFGQRVYFTALKLTGSPAEAEDILQDTFLTAFEKLGGLNFPENFGAWVTRIAVNKCNRFFKDKALADGEEVSETLTDEESIIPDNYVDDEQKRKIIMDIIDRVLTEQQRQTVILYYYDELSVSEIAKAMNCSTGTVTSRLSAARAKIKEAVLIYEEKNKDRLHAVVPIPILTKIFEREAESIRLPKMAAVSGGGSSVGSESLSDKKLKTNGGKTMLSSVKSKIIAGIAAVAVTGGVIGAVVLGGGSDSDPAQSGLSASDNSEKGSKSSSIVNSDSEQDSTQSEPGQTAEKDIFWITSFDRSKAPTDKKPYLKIGDDRFDFPLDLNEFKESHGPYYFSLANGGINVNTMSEMMQQDNMISTRSFGGNYEDYILSKSEDISMSAPTFYLCNTFGKSAPMKEIFDAKSYRAEMERYIEHMFDTEGWEGIGSLDAYENNCGLDDIVNEFGCPTSAYYSGTAIKDNDHKGYKLFWETDEYTVVLDIGETLVNGERYIWQMYSFTYYASGYPKEEIYKDLGDAIWTSENSGPKTDNDDTSSNAEPIKDLSVLNLKSEPHYPKDITVEYKDFSLNLKSKMTPQEVREAIKETPITDEDKPSSYIEYGKTSSIFNILSFSWFNGNDNHMHDLSVDFTTTIDVSLLGINKDSTPEEIVNILGTPQIGEPYKTGSGQCQDLRWDNITIANEKIDSIGVCYKEGVLDSIRISFD